jgi:membrane peptidoglycan carboxypeptidase
MSQTPPPYRPRRASLYTQPSTSPRSPRRRGLRWLAWVGLVGVMVASTLMLYVFWTVKDLPDPGQTKILGGSVYVYDRNGQQIAQLNSNGQYYQQLPLQKMGRTGPLATLAAEDRTFYRHGAIDYAATARAIGSDILHRGATQGGSTITQQLVKISLLTPQQSVFRKMQEAVLATAMEGKYSKDKILEMYLNRVNYGHNAYGLGAATKIYFGNTMTPDRLSPGQAAFLAGLINGPAYYDPQLYYDRAKQRQLYVLDGMVKMGVLTQPQAEQAAQENIQAELKFDQSFARTQAPHFVTYVIGQAEKMLGADVVQQGLAIYTTLDLGLQAKAQQSVTNGVKALSREGVNNGDLLAANPKTGEILAFVGSADYYNTAIGGQTDMIEAARQPGSSFKPYTFEAALKDQKINLSTSLQDTAAEARAIPGYQQRPPVDFDNSYMGNITARRSLLLSRNIPALQVGQMEGIDNVISVARSMGVQSQLKSVPSTAIGGSEVTMLDQVQGYQVFANQGQLMPLTAITRIMGVHGDALFQQTPGQQAPVAGQPLRIGNPISAADAYLVTDTLKQYQYQWGLGWRPQMAGKSGTTGGATGGATHPDAWMMGYNPNIVVGAWAGNTVANGPGRPVSTFGTEVGQRVLASFINGLPTTITSVPWYAPPAGITTGYGCGYREYYLTGASQTTGCVRTQTVAPIQNGNGNQNGNQGNGNGNGNGNGSGNGRPAAVPTALVPPIVNNNGNG